MRGHDTAKTKRSATEMVYEELKRQILTFQLLPGKVLGEQDILRKLGFSRTPFREACMRLKEEGWLLAFSRRGYLIAPVTIEDIADLYELRLIVESACAQIAAGRATAIDIDRLRGMVRMEEQHSSGKGITPDLIRMNFDFHMSLAELTGNTRLVNIVRLVLEHVMRFDSMLSRYSPSTSWVKHGRIMRAISAHDSIGAWRSMQKHIEQARLRILSVFAGHSAKLNLVPLRYGAAFSLPDGPGMQSTKGNQPTIPSLARGQGDDDGKS